jgi:Uma2 family endonuclease
MFAEPKLRHSLPMNAVLTPSRRRISVDEYHRMDEAGIFGPQERVELLDGEIYVMAPIGLHHSGLVTRLNHLLQRDFGSRVVVQIQGPVWLSDHSEPQPDLTVLRIRTDAYFHAPATPDDVILLIEVADSSLRFDRGAKKRLYAAAGVREYWIVNVAQRCIESYPSGQRFALGEAAHSSVLPDLRVDVSELFAPLIQAPNPPG